MRHGWIDQTWCGRIGHGLKDQTMLQGSDRDGRIRHGWKDQTWNGLDLGHLGSDCAVENCRNSPIHSTLVFGLDLKYLNLWHFYKPIFSYISNF